MPRAKLDKFATTRSGDKEPASSCWRCNREGRHAPRLSATGWQGTLHHHHPLQRRRVRHHKHDGRGCEIIPIEDDRWDDGQTGTEARPKSSGVGTISRSQAGCAVQGALARRSSQRQPAFGLFRPQTRIRRRCGDAQRQIDPPAAAVASTAPIAFKSNRSLPFCASEWPMPASQGIAAANPAGT